MKNVLIAVRLLLASLTPACAYDEGWLDDEPAVGESEHEGRLVNGRLINGRLINGTAFSGTIASVSLDHVLVGSQYINDVVLSGGQFSRERKRTASFEGAVFDATLTDGNVIPIEITSIRQAASDLWAYSLSYDTGAGWLPVCVDASGSEVEAYALNDVWDMTEETPTGGRRLPSTTHFTFACRASGAIGKCVDFGYVPWRTVGNTTLVSYHDTCVRAVRADWCGDGKAWTVDGTLINLFDRKLVQTDTETWPAEAEWSPNGAVCLNTQRVTQGELRGELIPSCAKARQLTNCGTRGLTSSNSVSLHVTERYIP